MKILPQILLLVSVFLLPLILASPLPEEQKHSRHFDFEMDNGYKRSEDVSYNVTVTTDGNTTEEPQTTKPIEIRGGYSYISDDGYEYQVFYKANKKGFQPYVTAHKVHSTKD
ncbi:larval cuticle protein 65Ag1 [Drosophila albomicans]|uniref:Larval cuticle protein 65Ag1 n=1 Tax=Drosophila albomicans TaxID=7291 RepID=A0A6P8X536_DROAB|nr:larval cuticle protein 65Ag1 [Drosophila albomicans]